MMGVKKARRASILLLKQELPAHIPYASGANLAPNWQKKASPAGWLLTQHKGRRFTA
jgi:hypothetical protein